MAEVRVIQLPDGQLQVFVDGDDLPFEEAERITKAVVAELGASIPGGVKLTSAIESHRDGRLDHVHVVGGIEHGH